MRTLWFWLWLCAWGVALGQPETRVYSLFAPPGEMRFGAGG